MREGHQLQPTYARQVKEDDGGFGVSVRGGSTRYLPPPDPDSKTVNVPPVALELNPEVMSQQELLLVPRLN